MRIFQITFCFMLLMGVCLVQANPRTISMNLSVQETSPLKVYQDVPVKVTNSFQANLYDLSVTKPPLSRKIVSVGEFLSGQSFDLSFSKVGAYEICFSKKKNEQQTCRMLDVLKRTIA